MRIFFYATESDIYQLIKSIFYKLDIKLVKGSWLASCDQFEFSDINEFSSEFAANTKLRMYFACKKEIPLKFLTITLNSGQAKHSVNHGVMPDSIRIMFGKNSRTHTLIEQITTSFGLGLLH